MKALCSRLLIWLIEPSAYLVSDKKEIKAWLAFSYTHPGFRKFAAERNYKFLKELGGGSGMQPLPRDNYTLKFGQRLELTLLEIKTKAAFLESEKDRLAKKMKT